MSDAEPTSPPEWKWHPALPDPDHEALSALVGTISSNCLAQGTTGPDDIVRIVRRYQGRYPEVTVDMVRGGIFAARRAAGPRGMHSMTVGAAMMAGGMAGGATNAAAVPGIGHLIAGALGGEKAGAKRQHEPNNDDGQLRLPTTKKKKKRPVGDLPATTVAIDVSRTDVERLLHLQFDDDSGQLTRIEWADASAGKGGAKSVQFVKSHFSNHIPAHFAIKGGGARIFQIGVPSGKLPNQRGGRDKTHTFDVYFHGKCLAEKDGCPTKWRAGFEKDQLQLLSDPECDGVEMRMMVQYGCQAAHPEGKFYGSAKERKEKVRAAEEWKKTYGPLIHSSACERKKKGGGTASRKDEEGVDEDAATQHGVEGNDVGAEERGYAEMDDAGEGSVEEQDYAFR